jgi:hypothetical protein
MERSPWRNTRVPRNFLHRAILSPRLFANSYKEARNSKENELFKPNLSDSPAILHHTMYWWSI